MARKVFHSSPSGDKGWKVTSGGRMISEHRTQKASEKAAISAGHRAQDKGGLNPGSPSERSGSFS